jgi:hypothetical protein
VATMMRRHLQLRPTLFGALAMLVVLVACGRPPEADRDVTATHVAPARGVTPHCTYRETGFRSGVNPPRQVERVEPDWTGLPTPAPDQMFIVEARIDGTGRVTEDCMLRGVNPDADRRVLEAVRAWRFEPPRLLAAVESREGRWEAGAAVPVFMTLVVRRNEAVSRTAAE